MIAVTGANGGFTPALHNEGTAFQNLGNLGQRITAAGKGALKGSWASLPFLAAYGWGRSFFASSVPFSEMGAKGGWIAGTIAFGLSTCGIVVLGKSAPEDRDAALVKSTAILFISTLGLLATSIILNDSKITSLVAIGAAVGAVKGALGEVEEAGGAACAVVKNVALAQVGLSVCEKLSPGITASLFQYAQELLRP